MPSPRKPKVAVSPLAGKIAVGTVGVTTSSSGVSGGGGGTSLPGGSNGAVQANLSNTFGGTAVTYDGTTFVFPTTFRMKNGSNVGTISWNPSGTRSLNLPDASDTLVGRATPDTLTNKIISGAGNTLTVRLANDVTGVLLAANGGTGQAGVPGSTTEFLINLSGAYGSAPNIKYTGNKLQTAANLQFLGLAGITGDLAWAPTTSNKTLTLPDATDTLIGRGTTDNLVNKTLTSPNLTGVPVYTATSLQATGNARFKIFSDIANIQTSNATVTTAFSWTITDECVTTIGVEAEAISSDGSKNASYVRRVRIKRDGGVVTVAPVSDIYTDEDAAFDCDITIDNSSATGRVRVTGLVSTTIDWGLVVTRLELTHA